MPPDASTAVADEIRVEVCYALPERQYLVTLTLPAGATAADALALARADLPELPGEPALGIYGRLCSGDSPLRSGDRLEIYRPLRFDPMESRRRRAAKAAATGGRSRL